RLQGGPWVAAAVATPCGEGRGEPPGDPPVRAERADPPHAIEEPLRVARVLIVDQARDRLPERAIEGRRKFGSDAIRQRQERRRARAQLRGALAAHLGPRALCGDAAVPPDPVVRPPPEAGRGAGPGGARQRRHPGGWPPRNRSSPSERGRSTPAPPAAPR